MPGATTNFHCKVVVIFILLRVPGPCLTMPSWSNAGKTPVPLLFLECMCPCGHEKTWLAKGQHASMGSYVAMHMWNMHKAMQWRRSPGGTMWSRATRDSMGSLQHGISCVSRAGYMQTWVSMDAGRVYRDELRLHCMPHYGHDDVTFATALQCLMCLQSVRDRNDIGDPTLNCYTDPP